MNTILLIGSHRKNGNSQAIASFIQERLPYSISPYFISDYNTQPCIACGFCNTHHGLCTLDDIQYNEKADKTKDLFDLIEEAKQIIFISPIYFYHAPAHVKAFLDRSQRYWSRQKEYTNKKKFYPILFAARQQGEQLFTGYELTLKYVMPMIGAEIISALKIYGLEEKNDFLFSENAQNEVKLFIQHYL